MEKEYSMVGLENDYDTHGYETKQKLIYDEVNNNLILLSTYGDCEFEDIINGIRKGAYNYLIKTLNENKNLVVDWFALEGTTSDYIIYHGLDANYIEEAYCPMTVTFDLRELRRNNDSYVSSKYLEYKNDNFELLEV